MDRGQTFFSMDGAKIFLSHMVKARIYGSIMVAPLFIDEENSKLPPKYSNCVTFVAFRHS